MVEPPRFKNHDYKMLLLSNSVNIPAVNAFARFFLTKKEKKTRRKEQPQHGDDAMLCKIF